MEFYELLRQRGLDHLLRDVTYQQPIFLHQKRLFDALDDIVTHNRLVCLISDYDVDGASCLGVEQEAFKLLGFKNFTVAPYVQRTHRLDAHAVYFCLQSGCDYVIVTDTGSSDVQLINRMVNEGKKVIVLDHHSTDYVYEFYGPSVIMVNTILENQILGEKKYNLSAGALTYCVFDAYLRYKGITETETLAVYGAISLFADCMDMGNDLNRAIYYRAKGIIEEKIPSLVSSFMGRNARFNSRFINYSYSPLLNAAFRSENLEVLNSLLLPGHSAGEISTTIQTLKTIHEECRALVGEAVDTLQSQIEHWQHFVVCDLRKVEPFISVDEKLLYNYTGLIANKLANGTGKTALVYCGVENMVRGSVRDPFGRNFLTLFQQLCYAGGHGPAFGINVNRLDFPDVIAILQQVDSSNLIKTVVNEPIILDWPYATVDPNVVGNLIRVSELSGQSVPKVLLRKKIFAMKEVKTDYDYCYTCGTGQEEFRFYSPRRLEFYNSYLFEPVQKRSTFFTLMEE